MEDDRISSNFETALTSAPMSLYNSPESQDVFSPQPAVPTVPPEPPIDYTALSEAKVYELLSENGAVQEMNVSVSMIDKDNGSGKAMINIGKDIKRRRFEIPISIKNGNVHLGKAIDIDTGKTLDIGKSSKILFEAPDKDRMDSQLIKTYEKHSKFFYGRPSDIKVKALMTRFPSMSDEEARLFLDEQYYSRRGQFYASVDKIRDAVKKNRKNIILFGIGATVAIAIFLSMRKKERESQGIITDVREPFVT